VTKVAFGKNQAQLVNEQDQGLRRCIQYIWRNKWGKWRS